MIDLLEDALISEITAQRRLLSQGKTTIEHIQKLLNLKEEIKMTRFEKLCAMRMIDLVNVADKLGVKINKKGSKAAAVEKILEAEAKVAAPAPAEEPEVKEDFTKEEVEEIEARVACGETLDSAMQTVIENGKAAPASAPVEEPQESTEKPAEKPAKAKTTKKTNLKIKELTFEGRTQTIKAWAEELNMPWPTLYDRVNRNGWSVEEALTIPLGERRKKA